jgi:superfamily II DNA or RNA helicase
MLMETLVPVEGCWVLRSGAQPRLGLVRERRQEPGGWKLKVQWFPEGFEWIPLDELISGIQLGWTVQDIPTSAVRKSLGLGETLATRELSQREQVLVQWHETGLSTWMPYQNLRRIKDASMLLRGNEYQHQNAAERFRLRLMSYALENWNQLTGSLDRLDIDPLPHQIQLVHRIMTSGHSNWLIADDVGLGKTIEVGLLLAALKRKGNARRVLVVAPAGLTRQWRDEMEFKFQQIYRIYGVDFTEESATGWKLYDHVIISLDLAKREEHLRRLRAAGSWDIVIFDEGHRLTRHGDGERSDRYRLAEALRAQSDSFLLLSGTPHQGYTDRFKGLLYLIRPDLRRQIDGLEANPELVADMILRNQKSKVTDAKGNLIFRGHEVHRFPVSPSLTTQHFQRKLTDYLRRGYRAGESGSSVGRAIGFVMVTYRKLASSSIAAIEKALVDRLRKINHSTAAGTYVPGQIVMEELLEGGDNQDNLSDIGPSSRFFDNEEAMLTDLISTAQAARQDDEKLNVFLDKVVTPLLKEEKRLLVFTEYRATQEYIQKALQDRFPQEKVALINGSMTLSEKMAAIRAFRDDTTFMISTEAGGEGINLQESCHVMVNYDLPWNPARLVQRIGRLYRYGQKSKVVVFNLHAADSFDNQAVTLMFERVMTVAREMAPVGEEFSNALYAEILGELLENIDMASILNRADIGSDERTKQEIDEAIRHAQQAQRMQEELLRYAAGFDPAALSGSFGLGMSDVKTFIRSIAPFRRISVEAETHDGRVLELRLPEELKGKYPEFHQRTVVRVTSDRSLAQRISDVHLLDFESSFFSDCIQYAQNPGFGGTHATINMDELPNGVLAAHKLRWQNDQGDPLIEELFVGHCDQNFRITINAPSLLSWMRGEGCSATEPDLSAKDRESGLRAIRMAAETRLGGESSRFKHPNSLILLSAASTIKFAGPNP